MKQIVPIALVVVGSLVTVSRAQDGMLFPSTAGSFVNVASAPALSPQNAITVEAWFYCDPASPLGGNRPAIVRKDPSGSSYILRNSDNNNGFLEWILWTQTSSITTLTSPNLTPVLSWHHYAGTYDGSAMRMYLDGVEIASVAKTGLISIAPGPVTLGQGGGSSDTWNGYLDEIRIWSIARTAAEIQSTMGVRIDGDPGLVAAWHFDGGFQDFTGGHHGTPVSGATILPATSPVTGVYLQAPPIAAIGGPLPFSVFATPAPAPYILEISFTGTSPGTQVPPPGSGVFPLNEPFIYSTFGGAFPNVFQGFIGFTDATGHATPVFNVPAIPALIGLVVSSAFIVIDGSAPWSIGDISNATQTTITNLAPFISGVSPPTGPTAGGWAVTVSGANFQGGATVRFDGVAATNVVVSPNSITCLTPPGSLGLANVTVENPDGNETTLSNAFTYVPTLLLSGTSPIVTPTGALVTVNGSGFTTGLTASLAGTPLVPTMLTPTSFRYVVPPGTFCSAALVVSLPDGQAATIVANPSPVISGIIGPPGNPAGGSSFFVLGANFHAGTTVTIGGAPAAISSMSTTVVLATAPPGSSGLAPLVVTSAAGCAASSNYLYQ